MEQQMKRLKVIQCEGHGQGSCKRCLDNGKWNRMWMPFLYKIDGLDGCYCWECVKELDDQKDVAFVISASVAHARWVVYRDDGDCRCSNCDTYYEDNGETIPDYWNYCPHCGAKMDKTGN